MSEVGEVWSEHKKIQQKKKVSNQELSTAVLKRKRIPFVSYNHGNHLFVDGKYDFWPSTGKFIDRRNKLEGRGVFSLIQELANEHRI